LRINQRRDQVKRLDPKARCGDRHPDLAQRELLGERLSLLHAVA
jgi:hypothetical protein